jgi:hypothetical protein
MISPTRSRDLVSGGLTALLAALEGAQDRGAEAIVHPHKLSVLVRPCLITRFRHGATGLCAVPPVVYRPRPCRRWRRRWRWNRLRGGTLSR